MAWTDLESAASEGAFSALSEPVILPGSVTANGIFFKLGQPTMGIGRLDGIDSRLFQGPSPVLYLTAIDGAALVEGDRITARGSDYLVSRIDPDGQTDLRIELVAAPE